VAGAGCVGDIGDGEPGATISQETADEVGASGMRRLSVAEYQTTVLDLLQLDAASASELLPSDTLVPFDNDYSTQTPSEALIKGAEVLAGDLAEAVLADPALRVGITGCEPSSSVDAACFRSFIETFGRRALRRPLTDDEIDAFAGLSEFAIEADDFWVGVGAALRAFLQHPQFLYRVEIGEPVASQPGIRRLDDFETATRLSYFLIGTTTPDWLLDAAEAGELEEPEGVADAAQRLFDDDRARARVARFHAMWLSYAQLSDTGVSGLMHDETAALLDRIIFDEARPWTDVLLADETFLTPELAEHYGLPSPGTEPGWVKYGDSGRKGLLSHGTFLSAASKFGDTSPTQRGLLVRARLFCQTIEKPPPDLNVDIDEPPPSSDPNACKAERYSMSKQEACSGCHTLMDPIGFGLEAFDATGRFRETEPNRPDCPIDGEGDFVGVGTFNGPGELAVLAVESGLAEACVARQLYRFAVGRFALDDHDLALLERVVADASGEGGLELDGFIRGYVTSDAFRYYREEGAK
jgi:hypothetical protein